MFYKDPEAEFGTEVRPGEARFGLELDGEKPWRRQVFGARMGARKERKVLFFIGFRGGVRDRKCDQERRVLDQN